MMFSLDKPKIIEADWMPLGQIMLIGENDMALAVPAGEGYVISAMRRPQRRLILFPERSKMAKEKPITSKLTDSKGRVLAEDKGDGKGLQEIGNNLKESLAEVFGETGHPATSTLFDERGHVFAVPAGTDGKPTFYRAGTDLLKHDFTDRERAELSARAGQIDKDASEKEARLTSFKKQMQGEIDSDRAEVSNILQKCRDGYEVREFRTGTILHCPVKGKKIVVRLDNDLVVKVLDMAPHEFQTEMFDTGEEGGDVQE